MEILSIRLHIKETVNDCCIWNLFYRNLYTDYLLQNMFWQLLGPLFIRSLSKRSSNPLPCPAIGCIEHPVPTAGLAMWPLLLLGCSHWQDMNRERGALHGAESFPKEPRGKNVLCFHKAWLSSRANSGGHTENLIVLCSSGPLHWWPLKPSFNTMNEILQRVSIWQSQLWMVTGAQRISG